jgi:hypothetical protein
LPTSSQNSSGLSNNSSISSHVDARRDEARPLGDRAS